MQQVGYKTKWNDQNEEIVNDREEGSNQDQKRMKEIDLGRVRIPIRYLN